uniref:Lipase_3 domain-containing protein n=1 Tax=Steinernema glaseri TaxID=37863 RepID=A0A1I7Z1I6_9BILA
MLLRASSSMESAHPDPLGLWSPLPVLSVPTRFRRLSAPLRKSVFVAAGQFVFAAFSRMIAFVALLALLGCVSAKPLELDAPYQDGFARARMLPMSAAAYADNPQLCVNRIFPQGEYKRLITKVCDPSRKDTCAAFTAASPADKAIIVAFRGSNGVVQLFMEADETIFKNKTAFIGGGNVSEYFFGAFSLLWENGIKDDFMALKNKYPDYEVWVTGHSLGGSMATLCAGTILKKGWATKEKLKLVTFGQPRTGDQAFADAHDAQFSYSYRVTHKRDLVPHIPFKDMEGYEHHKYEVWYNNNMASGAPFKECKKDDSDNCSDGQLDWSIEDHLHYFGHMISEYGDGGCKDL